MPQGTTSPSEIAPLVNVGLQSVLAPPVKKRGRAPSKIDGRQWPATLYAAAYGVHLEVRADSAETLQHCSEYLPFGWRPSSADTAERLYSIARIPSATGASADYRLLGGGREIARSAKECEILDCLESDSALYVAEMSPRWVFVHAGVVGWRGRAILIPGRSHAGKSTLTAALVHAGGSYYSDEFAVIDQDGMVYPYARPLQIRSNGSDRQTRITIEQLGGVTGRDPLPAGLILLSQFRADAHWRPKQLSPGEALLGILGNTVSARRAPQKAMRALKPVVSGGFAVQGFRSEAEEVIHWIRRRFRQ